MIQTGDFIKADWCSAITGIVLNSGFIGKRPAWLIRDANGNRTAILKSQAVLVCEGEGDTE